MARRRRARTTASACSTRASTFARRTIVPFLDLDRGGDTHIGYASIFDLRRSWFHPQVKIPAGERIARWALATQYGFGGELDWQPPLLVSMQVRDGALVLQLDTAVGDPEGGAIQGFAIAGED